MKFDLFGLNKVAKTIVDGIDDVHFSGEERETLKVKIAEVLAQRDLAQAYINSCDAQSKSKVQSWWRPSIAWICVAIIGLNYLIFPLWEFVEMNLNHRVLLYPKLDVDFIFPIIMGMLGLAGARSYGKQRGTTK